MAPVLEHIFRQGYIYCSYVSLGDMSIRVSKGLCNHVNLQFKRSLTIWASQLVTFCEAHVYRLRRTESRDSHGTIRYKQAFDLLCCLPITILTQRCYYSLLVFSDIGFYLLVRCIVSSPPTVFAARPGRPPTQAFHIKPISILLNLAIAPVDLCRTAM